MEAGMNNLISSALIILTPPIIQAIHRHFAIVNIYEFG